MVVCFGCDQPTVQEGAIMRLTTWNGGEGETAVE